MLLSLICLHFFSYSQNENDLVPLFIINNIYNNHIHDYEANIDNYDIVVDKNGYLINNDNLLFKYSLFNDKYSFLIDYFGGKLKNESYLIITPIPNLNLKSSSSPVTLDRKEALIIDLSCNNIYYVDFKTPIVLFSLEYFNGLPAGLKLSKISKSKNKLVVTSKLDNHNFFYDIINAKTMKLSKKEWLGTFKE